MQLYSIYKIALAEATFVKILPGASAVSESAGVTNSTRTMVRQGMFRKNVPLAFVRDVCDGEEEYHQNSEGSMSSK